MLKEISTAEDEEGHYESGDSDDDDHDEGMIQAFMDQDESAERFEMENDGGDDEVDEDEELPEDERDELKEVQKLAQRETRRLWCWRMILLSCMFLAAAVVTTVTYRSLQNERDDEFDASYELFSNSIIDQLRFQRSNVRSSLKGMADSITGKAAAYGDEFPRVMVPDFEMLGQATRAKGSGILLLAFSPTVLPAQVPDWIRFTQDNAATWLTESRETAIANEDTNVQPSSFEEAINIVPFMFSVDTETESVFLINEDVYNPIWQLSPPPFDTRVINLDWTSATETRAQWNAMSELRQTVMSRVNNVQFIGDILILNKDHEAFHQRLSPGYILPGENVTYWDHPYTAIFEPVFKEKNNYESEIVGLLTGAIAWDAYLIDLLPDDVNGVTVVMENSCGQAHTYTINGAVPYYLGTGDMHETKYDSYKASVKFYEFDDEEAALDVEGHCLYTFNIYPTQELEDAFLLDMPIIIVVVVGGAFLFMIVSFCAYDWFVGRRNRKVLNAAATSNAIVSNMFPAQIREELLSRQKQQQAEKQKSEWGRLASARDITAVGSDDMADYARNQAIADFYPETSIMFADIVGFTAWSSVREPAQVFSLLEEVYESFDKVAKTRRIFKVETVGDCYVAATGLPYPRADHAIALARFARDCMFRMHNIARRLEVTLGPETADLTMRIGIHSGSVTAGVLRGERTRFQLFGDTMNTASRMESRGLPDRIQISSDTADLLRQAGKESWLTPREEMIDVKGKGMMQTYWLNAATAPGTDSGSSGAADDTNLTDVSESATLYRRGSNSSYIPARRKSADGVVLHSEERIHTRKRRLVKWNVEVMCNILRKIEAYRISYGDQAVLDRSAPSSSATFGTSGAVLDQVKEVISMPVYRELKTDPKTIELKDEVIDQLEEYVSQIAAAYRDNPFHNFEHASHVAMATSKLLSRVVNPKIDGLQMPGNGTRRGSLLHHYTYGLTSDPITEFACVFSSLIHDVDHYGIPNATLVKEKRELAIKYKQSVLEQNSFDFAWNLLMKDDFNDLRNTICRGPEELQRFRQVAINMVMATDIVDKELNGFRKQRWEKAFGENVDIEEAEQDQADRKATIVLEHMIQAADVAHTMQHWHIYQKWNKRLFLEMYVAYIQGRSEKDPSTFWYQGELGFFDFYIIPLAKKLSECGVFGVSSEEYLDYAQRNRSEWEKKGHSVLAEYMEEARELEEGFIKEKGETAEEGKAETATESAS